MSATEHMLEIMRFIREVDTIKRKSENLMELKQAQLVVALDGNNDEEIEKARFEVIECFAAGTDTYIKVHRKLVALKAKAPEA